MTLMEKIKIIERVDFLIRRKGTGSPKELANRLDISERYVYQLINLMKEMGAPILYCSSRKSYCYEYDVEFSIGFTNKQQNLYKIKGGNNRINSFFPILHDLFTK